eukprot:snap_masked-scaffold_7-processed-gene-10.46-mRNA-1 protein AED:1.00 eAED:1.00 QI:0/-1/0/0/-1/1/1/0/360
MGKECFEVNNLGPCGFGGTCEITDLNETNGLDEVCRCFKGWRQSKEMAIFFLDEQDIGEEGIALCQEHVLATQSIYCLILLTTIIALGSQFLSLRKKQQILRIWPFLLGNLLQISFAVYKLVDPVDAVLGLNLRFTFLVANSILFFLISMIIFFEKYISYIIRCTMMRTHGIIKAAQQHRKQTPVVIVYDILICQALWCAGFLTRPQNYAAIRIVFSLFILRIVYTGVLLYVLYGILIKDMKMFLSLEVPTTAASVRNEEREEKRRIVSKTVVRIIVLRRISMCLVIFCFFFWFLPSVFDILLYYFGYSFTMVMLIWNIISITSIRARAVKLKKKGKSALRQTKLLKTSSQQDEHTAIRV